MTSPYLRVGLPLDVPAVAALVLALSLLLLARSARARAWWQGSRIVALLSLAALALSAGYVAHYLRGGPRIIDATSYWLEARALASGQLAFDVPSPTASFRGRFLLADAEGGALSVIFPPGYPALLALGHLARAPLVVGPVLAGLLVLATYWLARELLRSEPAARLAAALSAVCAALRYHTADTMSHGLSALLFAVGLASAARGGPSLLLGGFALGWLGATRPVTALVALPLCLAVALRHRLRVGLLLIALLPGALLLFVHQRAATGGWLESSQLRYYALADGPPGCFRYGFGSDIGCLFEHGDYVRARLDAGYGAWQAVQNTLRRLWVHGIDIANFLPWSLLVPFAMLRYRRRPGVVPLAVGALGTVLAYAGFYFDGSYPGGGARFFADILPLEHALLGLAFSELKWTRWAVPGALAGFALHAVHGHLALRDREGGRPMFEASVLEQAGVERGLIFVGTDHGFNLGHHPSARDPWRSPLVARRRGDARDALLWERFGRPPAYSYDYSPGSDRMAPRLLPYIPEQTTALRFETEAEWPVLNVTGGYAHPDFHPAPCVSQGRGLRLRRTGSGPVAVDLEVVPRDPGPHVVEVSWTADPPAALTLEWVGQENETERALLEPSPGSPCSRWAGKPLDVPGPGRVRLRLDAESAILDYVELTPAPSKLR